MTGGILLERTPVKPDDGRESGGGEQTEDMLSGWFAGSHAKKPYSLTLAIWPTSLARVAHLIRPFIMDGAPIAGMTDEGVCPRVFVLRPDREMARTVAAILRPRLRIFDFSPAPDLERSATEAWLEGQAQ